MKNHAAFGAIVGKTPLEYLRESAKSRRNSSHTRASLPPSRRHDETCPNDPELHTLSRVDNRSTLDISSSDLAQYIAHNEAFHLPPPCGIEAGVAPMVSEPSSRLSIPTVDSRSPCICHSLTRPLAPRQLSPRVRNRRQYGRFLRVRMQFQPTVSTSMSSTLI